MNLQQIKHLFNLWMHKIRMLPLKRGQSHDYQAYLQLQFERTFSKKSTPLQSTHLIDLLFEVANIDPAMRILCIGSRNTGELDYMKSKGTSKVIGIDLYSETPDILVMDMHQLKFPESTFDVIYTSHSLEHAYDADKVIREIIRVAREHAVIAIEVPIRYQVRGSDRLDFGSAEKLLALFNSHIQQVLACEEHPPFSEKNRYETYIARVVFTLRE